MSFSKNNPVLISADSQAYQIHHAGWIIADENTVIEDGYIEVENQKIIRISSNRPKGKIIDQGPGILMPPLVNTHLHLELSALKNLLPFDQGFSHWVKVLLEKRDQLGKEKLALAAKEAIQTLITAGVLFVGDISTLNITQEILENSALKGICFHEFLGTRMEDFKCEGKKEISISVAGHAPHSSSPQLLTALKQATRDSDLPFSIHVAESEDESVFIRDKKGGWADFLLSRGIDGSKWEIGGKTPVAHLQSLGILDSDTIAVHVLNADVNDMQIMARSKAHVCICPRSNLNLHRKLPDIPMMISCGIFPALGTDSLASCDSLSIFDEMKFIRQHYPELSCEMIFSMATINGARALKLDLQTGTLAPDKNAQFLYLPLDVKHKKNIFQEIICHE